MALKTFSKSFKEIEDIRYEVKNKLYKILRHQQSNNITKNIKFNFFEKS